MNANTRSQYQKAFARMGNAGRDETRDELK